MNDKARITVHLRDGTTTELATTRDTIAVWCSTKLIVTEDLVIPFTAITMIEISDDD